MEYNDNFTSGSLFKAGNNIGFTDLKQAYIESVIPVTDDDFNKIKKFNSVDEYKRHRDDNLFFLSKEESMRNLYHQNKQNNETTPAMEFYYAQQGRK
jgi:hypothetical protein